MAAGKMARDEMKKDVRELAAIAIEEKISKNKIRYYRGIGNEYNFETKLRRELKRDLTISYITGINQVTRRFVDKLVSVISKHKGREKFNLVLDCLYLMLDDVSERRIM